MIGGLAVIARVRIRATEDVDALITMDDADVDDVIALARAEGYEVGTSPEKDLREMGLLRMWGPPGRPKGTIADLIVANEPLLEDAIARATPTKFGAATLPMATLEDLVLMKLDANRPRDIEDVLSIKDAFGDVLDLVYARRQADAVGNDVRHRLDLYFPPTS